MYLYKTPNKHICSVLFLFMWGGGGGGRGEGEIMGWARPIFFREQGWAKRESHDGWGVGHCVFCKESHSLEFMWKT